MIRRLLVLLAAWLIVASIASSAMAAPVPASTMVWLDQPLPGAVLGTGDVPVTIHAASRPGIAAVRIFVDADLAAEIATGPGDLVVVEWAWPGPAPGQHFLTVVAMSREGGVSAPASAAVTIVGSDQLPTPEPSAGAATPSPAATPRPTPALTPTPTRAPTPAPTPAPCLPPAPLLIAPPNGVAVAEEMPTLGWAYRTAPSCDPTRFLVQVSTVRDFSSVLYSQQLPGTVFSWTVPDPLAPFVSYFWRVHPRAADGAYGPSSDVWTFCVRACR